MTDFERELSRELAAAAEGRPAAGDLLIGARRRLRRRRRVAVVGASVAVTVAVAVTASALALHGRGGHDPAPTGPSPTTVAGWQTVSYHDVTFQVPSDFVSGNPSQWCGHGGMPVPDGYIELPGTVSTMMACANPRLWYGVTLLSAGEHPVTGISSYPDGATFSLVRLQSGERLVIVTKDEQTNRQIAKSFRAFTGLDANGCPSSQPDIPGHPSDEAVACVFEANGQLRRSTPLGEGAAHGMRAAIRNAMQGTPASASGDGGCTSSRHTAVTVLLDAHRYDVVLDSPCSAENGLFQEGRRFMLTKWLVRRILDTGYSGVIGDGVPLPHGTGTGGPESAWTRVEHGGVSVELPPGWGLLDSSGCELQYDGRYGPQGEDPCSPDRTLAFYASATFDPAYGPGLREDRKTHTWGGYTYAGDQVVWISADDRATAERVLDSVEP